jgi:hypothetical protein
MVGLSGIAGAATNITWLVALVGVVAGIELSVEA